MHMKLRGLIFCFGVILLLGLVSAGSITRSGKVITIDGYVDGGNATAGGTNTLTNSTATWGTNEHAGRMVAIINGTGAGQRYQIKSNTPTVLTTEINWVVQPTTDSVFRIGYNWEDVYNASQDGGWGTVSKQGRLQYYVEDLIEIGIGGNESWFMDAGFMLEHNATAANVANFAERAIDLGKNANYVEGQALDTSIRQTGIPACHFSYRGDKHTYMFHPVNGTVELYGSSIHGDGAFSISDFGEFWFDKAWNVLGSSGANLGVKTGAELFNVNTMSQTTGGNHLSFKGAPSFFQNYFAIGNTQVWNSVGEFITGNATMDGIFARTSDRLFNANGFVSTGNRITFLDTNSEIWNINTPGSTMNGIIWRTWRFNVKVVDGNNGSLISGASVSLVNASGAAAFKNDSDTYEIIPNPVSTDANGDITQYRVDEAYWVRVGGSNPPVSMNPFTLVVNKTGYFPQNYTFNLTQKTDLIIPLYKKWTLPNTKHIELNGNEVIYWAL